MSSIFASFIKIFNVTLVLSILSFSALAQNTGSEKEFNKSFKRFDLVQMDASRALSHAAETGKLSLSAAGRNFVLSVEPNDLRGRNYRAEDVGFYGVRRMQVAPVNTYRGKIAGDNGSEVRLTIDDNKIEGVFVTNGDTFFVEPANRYSRNAPKGQLVVYKKQDFIGEDGFSCPSELDGKIDNAKSFVTERGSLGLDGPGVIELATEADKQYVDALQGAAAANAEIMSILNMVEGNFDQELKLTIQVTYQHTWSVQDPFNGSGANALLNSFQAHWNTDPQLSAVHRDAAHLFSAKPAVLSMGYANIGDICVRPDRAYAFSGRIDWAPAKYLLTAHELGHNLNAYHADDTPCANTVMNSQINGSTAFTFCPFSRNEINTFKVASGDCLAPPISASAVGFDFDGDRKSDISIFRPSSGQWWYLRSIDETARGYSFGNSTDKTVPGDFTGDGRTDVAIYRESTGEWFILRSEDGSFYSARFGAPGDIPAPADFDGDGRTNVAVYRPSDSVWYILDGSGGMTAIPFGLAEDVPVPADYDGDGNADVAIFRPSVSQWWVYKSTGGVIGYQFGSTGDKPVPADYTGDGKVDIAVFRPSGGNWFILRSEDVSFYGAFFGTNGDTPAPADYDGDGKADIAVWRANERAWYLLGSQSGFRAYIFGATEDRPVPASFVP